MVDDMVRSPSWDSGPAPSVAVVVTSYRRPDFLPGLLAALERQTLPREDFEVVIADNGSADETWSLLERLIAGTTLRATAVRLDTNMGPGGGRNRAVPSTTAPVIAFTDDDCLPSPTWLAETVAAFDAGADLVQGQVHPDPSDRDEAGPWFHTKSIISPTPFFETCNVAYRRTFFEQVSGFDETDSLTAQGGGGRAFGEDALLAWRVKQAGGRGQFVPESLVYHRNIPADFHDYLKGQRYLVGFPGLGQRSGLVADWFWHGYFLSNVTGRFDLAVASVIAAALTRRPLLLIGVFPWLRWRWVNANELAKGDRLTAVVRLAQLGIGDSVSLWALVRGSVRHRRLVL